MDVASAGIGMVRKCRLDGFPGAARVEVAFIWFVANYTSLLQPHRQCNYHSCAPPVFIVLLFSQSLPQALAKMAGDTPVKDQKTGDESHKQDKGKQRATDEQLDTTVPESAPQIHGGHRIPSIPYPGLPKSTESVESTVPCVLSPSMQSMYGKIKSHSSLLFSHSPIGPSSTSIMERVMGPLPGPSSSQLPSTSVSVSELPAPHTQHINNLPAFLLNADELGVDHTPSFRARSRSWPIISQGTTAVASSANPSVNINSATALIPKDLPEETRGEELAEVLAEQTKVQAEQLVKRRGTSRFIERSLDVIRDAIILPSEPQSTHLQKGGGANR